MWSNIIAKIKSILDSNSLIQESYDYEEVNFKGQPAVVIVPSDNESNFTTNIDNERVYGVTVFLFVARGENYYKDKKCDEVMRNLVDSVIDDFDKDWQLDGLELNTGYAMLYMEASPSSWGYINREMAYRMAQIDLKIHLNVDVNQIT